MKAAVLKSLKSPLQIMDLNLPELKEGQVLVKMSYSGLCRSQLMEISGGRGEDKHLPHLLGHEGCGKIIKVGAGVEKVKENDSVILTWIKGSGCDIPSSSYKCHAGKSINSGAVTTLGEFTVVSENRCILKPDCISEKEAVLFGCALPTGMGIVINELDIKPDSTIAIFGLGGVGMGALIASLTTEDLTIIVIDNEEFKLEIAKKLGAQHTICAKNENSFHRILEITNNHGVDYSVDASGNCSVIELAFKSVKDKTGLCVFASHPPSGNIIKLDPHDLIRGKRIQGSWGGGSNPDFDIPKFAKLCVQNNIPLDKLLSKPYKLEDINQAFSDLSEGKLIRALIEMRKSV